MDPAAPEPWIRYQDMPQKGPHMLVFSRKIGQQVVLPEQGVTIDVMSVGKRRVRLGISTPLEVPVHRREAWDRGKGGEVDTRAGQRECGDAPPGPGRLAGDGPDSPAAPPPSSDDLDRRLIRWITRRTGGRVSELSVARVDGKIVIRGSVRSYYVRQLAQAAVNEVLSVCECLSPGPVEYEIDVAQVYWRSAGPSQGFARLRKPQH